MQNSWEKPRSGHSPTGQTAASAIDGLFLAGGGEAKGGGGLTKAQSVVSGSASMKEQSQHVHASCS